MGMFLIMVSLAILVWGVVSHQHNPNVDPKGWSVLAMIVTGALGIWLL
jgi:hypothetical protein